MSFRSKNSISKLEEMEADLKLRFNEAVGEIVGAAVGTSVGMLALGYGVFVLVTNSLETIF